MILHCNFEELGALRAGANALLAEGRERSAPVAAPPVGREEIQALLPRLQGDLVIETLAEQQDVARAVRFIVGHLKEDMDLFILSAHPADESAVASYFFYAHALTVLARLAEMGQEMEALIEVVTGAPPTEDLAETFVFPS